MTKSATNLTGRSVYSITRSCIVRSRDLLMKAPTSCRVSSASIIAKTTITAPFTTVLSEVRSLLRVLVVLRVVGLSGRDMKGKMWRHRGLRGFIGFEAVIEALKPRNYIFKGWRQSRVHGSFYTCLDRLVLSS